MDKVIDIIAVTYGQTDILKCFINSIKSQTNPNWRLLIIHDGLNKELNRELVREKYVDGNKVIFIEHGKRTEKYGHELRSWALNNISLNEYVLLTNGDNYYTPNMIEEVLQRDEEFIYFDLVHSHKSKYNSNNNDYGYMQSHLIRGAIDMGNVIIKSEIAKKIGFNSDEYHADWIYFDEALKLSPTIFKINKILFVHN